MESDFCAGDLWFCFLVACVSHRLIDIRKKQKWGYPFHVFGTNPLFIYIVAGVLATLLEVITVGESSLQEKIYTSI